MNKSVRHAVAAAAFGVAAFGAVIVAPMSATPAIARPGLLTRTLLVEKMVCAACPITVRKAITRVKGVRSVEVNFKAKTAIVVFDPAVTSLDAIAKSSAEAGYPARLVEK